MGHLDSVKLPEPATRSRGDIPQVKSRWWLWVLIVALIAGGIWYYRGHSSSQAATDASAGGAAGGAAGAGGKGKGGAGGGGFAVPVVASAARKGDLPVYLTGLGTVTAFNTVTVKSRVDGQIVKVNFTEGQTVEQGESLIEIDPRPYQVALAQAEGQMAKDQAQLKDVQVDLDRYKTLFKEGVIAKQQVDTQTATVGQSQGSIQADQAAIDSAKLQLTYSHITAPISGRVGLRLVDVGNIVHASDTSGLVVITQLQPISVIFTLPQDQLPQVMGKLRAGGTLPVDAYDRDDTAQIATGKLTTVDNQIDTTTGTAKLKSVFTNEKNTLFPNQFVNVHLLVDTKKNVTIVPNAAIQRGPQGTYVFTVDNGNTVKIKNVTVAQTTGNDVGLSDGLNPGDVVVIDGQDKLQDGSKVTATMAAPGAGAAGKPASSPATTQGTQRGQSGQAGNSGKAAAPGGSTR